MKTFILKDAGNRCYFLEINGLNIYDITYCDLNEAVEVAEGFVSSFLRSKLILEDKLQKQVDKYYKPC